MDEQLLKKIGAHFEYSDEELTGFKDGDPRLRLMEKMTRAAARYSIAAEVVKARNCNSGYRVGDRLVLDAAGNFLTKLCPARLCVYLVCQLAVPVALINERFSEGLEPNGFHFMHQVRCLDVGVDCAGYGEVMLEVKVVPRIKN